MAYTKTVWVNNQAPAINAENLNKIEDGIYDSVRYADKQTLTDAQKTQARGNINAAPGGFGLGDSPKYIADANDAVKNGWYAISHDTLNLPDGISWDYSYLRVDVGDRPDAYIKQTITSPFQIWRQCELTRCFHSNHGGWQPWEWVNPPMQLGVEYRTTERYLGKPVYAQLFSVGACSAGSEVNLYKGVGTLNTDKVVSYCGYAADRALPYFVKDTTYNIMLAVQKIEGTYDLAIGLATGTSVSFTKSYVVVKYTKTTD